MALMEKPRRKITQEAWRRIGRELYGDKARHWAFRCISCGHVQTAAEIADRYGLDLARAGARVYVSCEGRLGGPGCNWSLGGLLKMHTLEVLEPESQCFDPVFEFADPRADAMVEAVKLAPRVHPSTDVRDWAAFSWPDWIPDESRSAIQRFYGEPKSWLRAAALRDAPPLGLEVTFRPSVEPIRGRFVFIANDHGHVIVDGAAVQVTV